MICFCMPKIVDNFISINIDYRLMKNKIQFNSCQVGKLILGIFTNNKNGRKEKQKWKHLFLQKKNLKNFQIPDVDVVDDEQ